MKFTMDNSLVGKRITLIEMVDEDNPIQSGMKGVVTHVGGGVINVRWDNGRNLGVIIGEDKYTISNSTD
jgi:hypothetical protein